MNSVWVFWIGHVCVDYQTQAAARIQNLQLVNIVAVQSKRAKRSTEALVTRSAVILRLIASVVARLLPQNFLIEDGRKV